MCAMHKQQTQIGKASGSERCCEGRQGTGMCFRKEMRKARSGGGRSSARSRGPRMTSFGRWNWWRLEMKPAKEEPRAGRTDGGKGERAKELMCSEELGTKQFTFANLDHILVPYNNTEGLWRILWYDVRGCKKLPLADVWALGPGSGWKPVCGPE